MIIPNIWKNKNHVPNHQPDKYGKVHESSVWTYIINHQAWLPGRLGLQQDDWVMVLPTLNQQQEFGASLNMFCCEIPKHDELM